jgi:hypothetical protein
MTGFIWLGFIEIGFTEMFLEHAQHPKVRGTAGEFGIFDSFLEFLHGIPSH